MTLAILVTIALAAAPIVLLLTTAGCATIAGIELPPLAHGSGYGKYGDEVMSTPGLEGYWRLDEPAGASLALDSAPPPPYNGNYVQPVQLQQTPAVEGTA